MAIPCLSLIGQSRSALPSESDVNLLCNGQRVIDLYAEIPDGALDLAMTQEQLDRPQVAGSSVDQSRLGPAKRMSAEERRVQAHARDSLRYQAGILAGGEAVVLALAAGEQELAGLLMGQSEMVVDGLPGLLRDLEFHGTTCLPLADCRSVYGVTVGRDVLDLQSHHIASAQLAVDGEIEERQIPGPLGKL